MNFVRLKNRATMLDMFFFSMILAVAMQVCFAQDSYTRPDIQNHPVSLAEAVKMALNQNPNAQIAAIQEALSVQQSRKALAALLPQASVGISEGVARINIDTLFGTRAGFLPQHEGPFQVLAAGTRFSVPIFHADDWEKYRAASSDRVASAADVHTTRENIAALTVAQYLLCIQLAATRDAAASQVTLAQRLYEQAAHQEEAGAGTGLDTLRAQQKLKVRQQALITSEEEHTTAEFVLVRLLNLPPATQLVLTDTKSFVGEAPQVESVINLEAAYVQRPEMQALDARIRAAHQRLSAARGERLPSLDINGTWREEGQRFNTAVPVYQYQASLSIPVFTGGRIHAEVASENLDIKRLEQERIDLRNRIALEVKTAQARLDAAQKEVEVANSGLQLAKEELQQAQDRFQAGASDNIEVVTAQDVLAGAYRDQIEALYKANQARADVAKSIGHIEDTYGK